MRAPGLLPVVLPFFLSACAAGASGGGSTTPGSVAPPAPVPLAALVDPETPGLVHIDAAALSRSPHHASVVDLLGLTIALWDGDGSGFLQALLHAREAFLFLSPDPGGDPQPVLVMRGDFTEGDARGLFPAAAEVAEITEHGIVQMHLGEGIVAYVGGHTLIAGRARAVRASIARQLEGGSGGLPSGGSFGALVTELGVATSNVGFALALSDATKTSIARDLGIPEAVLAPFAGFGLAMTLADGLEVRGTFMSDSSVQAAALLLVVNQIIARVREDDATRALGFEGIVGAIRLRRDGGNLLLMLSVGDQELRRATSTAAGHLRALRAEPQAP